MQQEGQRLGRYLLLDRIASGGMADVYRAKLIGVEGFEKEVAVKKILPYWSANPEFINMLVDEAKVLLHLTHANIVQVYELNREQDIYYLVMEYVHGLDLRALANRLTERGERLSLPILYYIASQICQGLQFAHEKKDRDQNALGIVHRDVSPQNILLSSEGEVKITDFGIAKAIGKSTETVTGTLKGKFAYMSPEQALGQKVDCQTDIFALGILLYELAVGQRCFKGANDLDTLEAVKKAEVKFPQNNALRPPAEFCSVILKALKKEKAERYASILGLLGDLKRLESDLDRPAMAHDLKNLLNSLFPERFRGAVAQAHGQQETLAGERKTKVLPPPIDVGKTVLQEKTLVSAGGVGAPQHKNKFKQLILYGGAACILGLFGYSWTQSDLLQAKPEIQAAPIPSPPTLAAVELKPEPPVSTPLPITKENEAKPVRFGSLIVAAKPWGRVFLPNVVTGAETPFSRNRIPAGEYVLKVSFPPEDKTASKPIRITGESTTRCQINFEGPGHLLCQ